MSSHQLQVPGAAALARWGLLDEVRSGGHPGVRTARVRVDGVPLTGTLPVVDGVGTLLSPRRTRLDHLLLRAAEAAGAEVADDVTVDGLVVDRRRVRGVRGRNRSGRQVTVSADLVVGADGKNSHVARLVGAATSRHRPITTVALYSYWSAVPLEHAELHHGRGFAAAAFPTDEDLTVLFTAVPIAALPQVQTHAEGVLLGVLDRCADLGERVRSGRRAERVRATPDVPNVVRESHGPGWALVGDAGLVMDPVTAQGISNAFLAAELLDAAVGSALDAGLPIDARLGDYERARDAAIGGMFDVTVGLAQLRPSRLSATMVRQAARTRAESDRFLAFFSGALPARTYLSPPSVAALLGWRGALSLLRRDQETLDVASATS
jgi:flavin-dependent dehydrogenase